MAITVTDAVIGLFTVCNTARVVAYIPQIVKIWCDRNGAAGVSYATWGLFSVAHTSSIAYAVLIVDDWRMAAAFVANLLCCLVILGLIVSRRRQFASGPTMPAEAGARRKVAPTLRVVPGPTMVPRQLRKDPTLMEQWRLAS